MLSRIYAVITCFERVAHTRKAIRSLENAGLSAEQIIVVDGGSCRECVNTLMQEFPNVHWIYGQGNLWWAEGMNIGLRYVLEAGCDYIFMLNQDCEILPETLGVLLSAACEHSGAGVFACLVLNRNNLDFLLDGGHRWKTHRWLPYVQSFSACYPVNTPVALLPTQPYKIDLFTGRGVLIARSVFERIGVFDTTHFPQRGGDDDLSLRVNRAGMTCIVVPGAKCLTGDEDCGATKSVGGFIQQLQWALFHPVGGSALTVHFWLCMRNCRWHSILPTYIYRMVVTTIAAWRRRSRVSTLSQN
jgi:GT2 family glycosyltransferase